MPQRHERRPDAAALPIHNFGAKWRQVVTSMPQLQYPLQIRLGGPQSWYKQIWRRENTLAPAGI